MFTGNCNCDPRSCACDAPGLSGFWGDLWEQGQEVIEAEADARRQVAGQSAHIDAQNEAVSDFETDALGPHAAGRISTDEAIRRIQNITNSFTRFCERLNYARALNGARDVQILAGQLIADLEESEEDGFYEPGPGGGNINLPVIGSVSTTTLALGGLAAFLLFTRSPGRSRRRK